MVHTKSVPSEQTPAPAALSVCPLVPLRPLENFPPDRMAKCFLPACEAEALRAAMAAAPQFAELDPAALLRQQPDGLRVVLLTEQDYYARQAAACLAALSARARTAPPAGEEDDDSWEEIDLEGLVPPEDPADLRLQLKDSLTVLHPLLLDPTLQSGTAAQPKMQTAPGGGAPEILLDKLSAKAVLVAAPAGPVLSPRVVQKLSLDRNTLPDLFLALHPAQVDLDLLEELRFGLGFQVCRVKSADQSYLRRVFLACAEDLNMELAPDLDPGEVVTALQRYRGSRFEETDLDRVLTLALRKGKDRPLCAGDLVMHPYRLQAEGWDRLQAMVGLSGVKQALRRQLAKLVLDDRRRQAGAPVTPACRNLAFSGPPGTGKSVTARLAAQILREEGCGTGRFVEAGREQLIGTYLGQTSPMIAELFERARGGVLFIDEAGALLTADAHDCYASEAVNALVRHMELEPETMVIFATYPEEMQRLLASNAGLSSRIAQVLHFDSYEEEALWEILTLLAGAEQMSLPPEGREACLDFFRVLRSRKGENFGNGREARRLFQAALEELALRTLDAPDSELSLTEADLLAAIRRLLEQETGPRCPSIGF